MGIYRVYFMDRDDHILRGRDFEAADDAAATARADQFCAEMAECVAVEIWQGARRLGRHQRNAG